MNRTQCKYCLDYKEDKNNPFITPCECRGTSRHVHYQCFLKWILIAPEAKKLLCPICNTTYALNPLEDLEVIPQETPQIIYIISHPFSSVAFLHYLYIAAISTFKPLTHYEASILYVVTQSLYHFLWYYIFTRHTQIKKKLLYLQLTIQTKCGALSVLHFTSVYFLLICPEYSFILGLVLGFIPQYHWKCHVSILKEVNQYQLANLSNTH
jgi:hypothetical protein